MPELLPQLLANNVLDIYAIKENICSQIFIPSYLEIKQLFKSNSEPNSGTA